MSQPADDQQVAIIGMSGRFPGAENLDALWRVIVEGRDALTRFTAAEDPGSADDPQYVRARGLLDGIDRFDAEFFGMTPAEAAAIDPQQRIWLEVAWEALETAGYAHDRHDRLVAVYAGSFPSTYLYRNLLPDRGALEEFVRMRRPQSLALMFQNDPAFLPTRTAYKLGLRGPAVNVQSACSTSLVAVALAVQGLLSYDSDIAIAGGVCIAVPQHSGYFFQEGSILSRDGTCRPYDASACGTVFGNGAGAVVLKRLADARRDRDRVLAVVRGAAINNDGSAKVSYFAPSVEGQSQVITTALALAGVEPGTIGYVEGHGTATPMGDPIEVQALKLAYGKGLPKGSCCLGSVKGNIGHLDAAAGVAGLIRAVLALHHRQLPPTAHFERPNPELRLEESPFYVATTAAPWPASDHPRRAAVSSFGIGGTNAHVVLEEAPATEERPAGQRSRGSTTLLLSARTREALDEQTSRLAAWLDADAQHAGAIGLEGVAAALKERRKLFAQRRAVTVSSWDDARGALRDASRWDGGVAVEGRPKIVLSLPGQGSLRPGALVELLAHEPELRATFARLAGAASDLAGFDLVAWARDPHADAEPIRRDNATAQLAIFCVDVALARWLEARGVRPDAFVGHSLGEWVAAHLAGVLSEADALWAVHRRGRHMQETGPGAALAVRLSEGDVARYLDDVALACVNGPQLCLLSGRPEAIEHCAARLAKDGVMATRMPIDVAVHSPLMDPVVATLREELPSRTWRAPERPILSTVTGRWMTPEEITNVEYWAAQPRRAVRFDTAVTTLLEEACCVVIETGMGDTLTSLAKARMREPKRHAAVALLGRTPEGGAWAPDRLRRAVNELWARGLPVDPVGDVAVPSVYPTLPAYAFQRGRFWREAPPEVAAGGGAARDGVANGSSSVSLRALATSGSAAPDASSSAHVERELGAIWTRLLGVPSVKADDDFFSVGGDSLLAASLADEVKRTFAVPIALGRVFELRTFGAIAAAIDAARPRAPVTSGEAPVGGAPSGDGLLISLARPRVSGGAHLFCICGIQVYQALANELAARHPVSGVFLPIEEKILSGSHIPRLQEMAAAYGTVIRAAQPHGPYRLAGVSFGGLLAFELARQLHARGEVVDFVGVFDSALPHTIGLIERVSAHARLVARLRAPYLIEKLSGRTARAAAGRRLSTLVAQGAPPSATPATRDDLRTRRANLYDLSAAAYCRRMPSFPGDLHYFRARERGAFENEAVPLDYNWSRFTLGRCHVHEVPGGHITMLSVPSVGVLAGLVRQALDSCLEREDARRQDGKSVG